LTSSLESKDKKIIEYNYESNEKNEKYLKKKEENEKLKDDYSRLKDIAITYERERNLCKEKLKNQE